MSLCVINMTVRRLFFVTLAVTFVCLFFYGLYSKNLVMYNMRRSFVHTRGSEFSKETASVLFLDENQGRSQHALETLGSNGTLKASLDKKAETTNKRIEKDKVESDDNLKPKALSSKTFPGSKTTKDTPKPSKVGTTTKRPQEKSTTAKSKKVTLTRGTKANRMSPAEDKLEGRTKSMTPTPLVPPMNKLDFKKIPKWDFEDIYRRDSHPRQTTCPESVMLSKDPDFQKALIPDIKIFMHKEDFNTSEWNRLYHFNNPFGFMGGNYTEVKEAVQLIPKLKDYQLLPVPKNEAHGCIRCAVVGTGGILNGSRMGKEIDSHEYVFRMNGAVTLGHEDDVGNKTSVYVHTAHSLSSSISLFKRHGMSGIPHNEGTKYVMIPEGMRDFQWLIGLLKNTTVATGPYRGRKLWTYYPSQFDPNKFYVLHPDFLRYIRNRFLNSTQLQSPHWHIFRPTNGAFTLFLALHVCDVVDAYGFITADHAKYPNYYCDKQKSRVVFYINHDYNLEIRTWKKLHDTKILKLYQGTEDTQKPENEEKKD
nr:PREDICTED: alpha-N-acetylgalactosaminide alpha-2,6-sialyltransferase 2-like isoform X1 [Lepisosteus oculatus]